jgi:undecaprenyl diphosphate synthase
MHVAIIMNGNGRWAAQRALPPAAGYAAGVAALRGAVESAAAAGVRTLTLYAICAPAGARPWQEIEADLSVLDSYLRGDARRCNELAVRISLIGNHERLCAALPPDCDSPEETRMRMHLRIVVDYSAHDHVIKTLWRSAHPHAPERFDRQLREIDATAFAAGAVDLLVRTGGGYCQSEFMLWEVAYARLYYMDCLWPDFTARCLQRALGCSAGDSDTVVSMA